MQLKLPASVYSADQLLILAEELHQYGRTMGRSARGRDASAAELSEEATALLHTLPLTQRGLGPAIEGLREALEQMANTAATVTLVVPAPPSTALKQELTSWLRTNVLPEVLVNFHVDPEIAGGMVIRGTSRIFDCSFRTRLLANQSQFTQVLDRV